ncbi:beta-glycosidase [Mucilaginibacter mali]|uniref:Beta-glycosidase n=1 Tax=Mucilaginibacter mali TaxID=2740462 RepID=A0A7D4QPY6_9SPHI|nr:glycoside hydrolase [Mucilaginibacter mali]QKJ28829.1 beta-glycosidase [Mucilaginibacter mali]
MFKNIYFLILGLVPGLSALAQTVPAKLYTVSINMNQTAQTIDNIGASGCWFSEGIGKYWPSEKKERIAELLFSQKTDVQGAPLGIGLSAWRFNIGAGTFEQGDSSHIRDFRRRTECFLNRDGTYDWTKQAGYQFFLQKAHDYGVPNLIAFSNSPPVQFTKNGLGFKTEHDFKANLKDDDYDAYTKFLTDVLKHFEDKGLHFNYISPVNEPQWDWSHTDKKGDQEGSPWQNGEIYHVARSLNSALDKARVNTKILLTEAGKLTYLYGDKGPAAHQLQYFFSGTGTYNLRKLNHVPAILGGHSYFSETNDSTLIDTRAQLAGQFKKHKVNYWQTEYSMLGDGYKDGAKGRRTAMDCALFLAKVIHTDLTVGNATAWQYWNAYEPGNADFDTRYYLIALKAAPDFKDGEFTATKNLWALGSYSRFVRPGMKRVITSLNTANDKLLISAYTDNKQLIVVSINYDTTDVALNVDVANAKKKYTVQTQYLTANGSELNMAPSPKQAYGQQITLPARSISTIVIN